MVQIGGITQPSMPPQQHSARKGNVSYVCPMDPEVREAMPGACPKCGMALERETPEIVEYTCPMHPEIIRDSQETVLFAGWRWNGGSPSAFMGRTTRVPQHAAPVLDWIRSQYSSAGSFHGRDGGGQPLSWPAAGWMEWLQLALASPVVLWGGWPFFQRGWTSLVNRHLNMFTLIAIGTGTAYLYSVLPPWRRASSLNLSAPMAGGRKFTLNLRPSS